MPEKYLEQNSARAFFLVNEWVLIKNIRKSKLRFLRGKENVLIQIRDCNKNKKILPERAWLEQNYSLGPGRLMLIISVRE